MRDITKIGQEYLISDWAGAMKWPVHCYNTCCHELWLFLKTYSVWLYQLSFFQNYKGISNHLDQNDWKDRCGRRITIMMGYFDVAS